METCVEQKIESCDADLKIQQYLDNQDLEKESITDGIMMPVPGIITNAMINEENNLEKQLILEQKKMREQMLREEKKNEEEKCFKRLNVLLSRSSIYVKFMAEKIQKCEIMEQKRLKRQQTVDKSKMETLKENSSAVVNDRNLRQSVKRKTTASPMKDNIRVSKMKKPTVSIVDVFRNKNMDKMSFEDKDTPESLLESDETNENLILFSGGTMFPYQIEGYKWLRALYENGVNGILADEMGLGKTIQCIAFISYLVQMGVRGPFFVCAPLSTLPNWFSEFQKFAPLIPVMLYHGSKEERIDLRRKILQPTPVNDVSCCPVVLTSYQIALFDSKLLSKMEWKMLVIDEAHRIKNFQCKLVAELKTYRSSHRLLMTGTPLQNNLAELWSLLNFILPEIFDDLKVFQSWFDVKALAKDSGAQEIIAKEQEKQIVSTIHQILTPFLLRRTKADVKLRLPQKKEVIVHAPLSKLQEMYYTKTLSKTIRDFFEPKQTEELGKRKSIKTAFFGCEDDDNIDCWESSSHSKAIPPNAESELHLKLGHIMMCLRKICNHPYLISYPLTLSGEYKVDRDLIMSSGKMRVLDILLPELKKRNHRVLLFSQFVSMLEILQDYCNYRGHKYAMICGDLSLDSRQNMLNSFKEDPSIFLFLISTRAGGLGLNIVSADTVIFYDSDFNPQSDIQAQDRCHRIGQTKPVVVYRLVVPSTIDENVIVRAAAKRKLEKVIIKKGRFSSENFKNNPHKVLSKEELMELLESTDISTLVKTDSESVLSANELEALMDRSDMGDV